MHPWTIPAPISAQPSCPCGALPLALPVNTLFDCHDPPYKSWTFCFTTTSAYPPVYPPCLHLQPPITYCSSCSLRLLARLLLYCRTAITTVTLMIRNPTTPHTAPGREVEEMVRRCRTAITTVTLMIRNPTTPHTTPGGEVKEMVRR